MAASCVALRVSSPGQLHYATAVGVSLPSLKRGALLARICPARCSSDREGGGGAGEAGGGGKGGSGGDPPRKKGGGDKGRRRFDAGFSFAEGGSGDFCVVPREQQPVNEYQDLTQSLLFPWATDDIWKYILRLAAIGGLSTLVIGWPVSAVSINASQEPVKCAVGALSGGLGASTLAVVRLYLGWAYVGNRLFSATVEYEETGWYDGEVWVKPPEVLARDRLLAYYKVKPALRRLKVTLVCLAISLATCSVLLFTLHPPERKLPVAEEDSPGPSVVRGIYSDKAARDYEPGAFSDEDDVAGQFLENCAIPAPVLTSQI
ncbi:hypothetical protein MPTK1_1g18510 [Marchantia polymorpha subsp. ruderalis]|uniref:DUF1230 family protein n=2 Tax=Marchantia polymorpha TaxID=3197 RepID=A0AAF6ARK7_MARPO|nr:hypothetical protein MARPO_0001s0189 [Marchantia polymorpha]BBM99077.1 hypothetical protein Mp_1g18510 [Marchantia polymorpha subsp. ruderalis]|eukprot:PTQ50154.1 hypothetical protein MARPO_0001s0189 [Marchantia polymorpha]